MCTSQFQDFGEHQGYCYDSKADDICLLKNPFGWFNQNV